MPNQKFQKPILYITIFLADDEVQLSLGFRFHIKSQASLQSLLQQQPKKRFQKSPEMTCFSVIKNPDGAFGFVVSHFISVFTTNCSVYFFFSFFYIMLFFIHFCFWLKLTVFQAQKAFVETRTCHPSQKLLFSQWNSRIFFFLSRAKKHFDIVLFFVVADISSKYIMFLYLKSVPPKKVLCKLNFLTVL